MEKPMFQFCCFQTEQFKSRYIMIVNDVLGDISFITGTMSQMRVFASVYLMIESQWAPHRKTVTLTFRCRRVLFPSLSQRWS